MSKIQLSELNPAGSELFQDSENFLNELNDRELGDVVGGFTFAASGAQSGLGISATVSAISNNANSANANSASNINTVVVA